MRNFIKIIACFILFSSLVSCGGLKKVDARKVPISGPERAKQNVKEGLRRTRPNYEVCSICINVKVPSRSFGGEWDIEFELVAAGR